ncbi:MAG TPA: IS110 family transposase [Acidobacteriota bacterium]
MNNKIFIGVDVSKGYADVEFRNQAGTFLKQGRVFDDTAADHRALSDEMSRLREKNADAEFVVGLEASGGLERNWEKFFRALKDNFALELLVLNPYAVKKHLERNLRRNRTDKISAQNIADYLAVGRRRQDIEHQPRLTGSCTLYRCINSAIGRRVQAQCELQSLLPTVQPELVQYCRDGLPGWILELLLAYPTAARLAKARVKTVAKIKQLSESKASKLIAAAKESVASQLDEHTEQTILFLVREIEAQNEKIAQLQQILVDSLKNDQEVKIIDSVTGIGTWTAIVLHLEYGNLERFHSADAAVAYAGLDPRIDESGDLTRHCGISRAGRSRIRAALFMPTLAAIRFNPIIRRFYQRLIASGKDEKLAVVACMRKLIHIVYACCVTGKYFDPNYQKQSPKLTVEKSTGFQSVAQLLPSTKRALSTAAPVSRKEAKKRKAAAMPQKGVPPLMRGLRLPPNEG